MCSCALVLLLPVCLFKPDGTFFFLSFPVFNFIIALIFSPLQSTRLPSSENQNPVSGKAVTGNKPVLRPRAALGEIGNAVLPRQPLRKKVRVFTWLFFLSLLSYFFS